MSSFKLYSRTIQAGETDILNARGNFCRNMAASGTGLEIKVTDGVRFQLNEGEKFRVDAGFDALQITNTSGSAITYELLIGEGDFDGSSLVGTVSINDTTPVNVTATGNVNVTDDTLYDRSNAGEEFAGDGNDAAQSANYCHLALHNPTDSGKTIVLRAIHVSSPNSMHSCYLCLLDGRLGSTDIGHIENKKNGGPASVATIDSNTASVWVAGYKRMMRKTGVNGESTYSAVELLTPAHSPIILGENESAVIIQGSTNDALYATFEWSEI